MRKNLILGLIVLVCLGLIVFLAMQPQNHPGILYLFIGFVGLGALDRLTDD